METNHIACSRKWLAAGLLLCLTVLIYSNTFNASWQMDDHPNIVANQRLHLNELNHDSILRSLFANPQASKFRELYRPVACLTLGLNWYFGQDRVFGYHLVNIAVHYCTALLLYLTIVILFDSPRLINSYRGQKHAIALLAATLWATHPIQTQAVTYIVQRMAAMAAMFYTLSLYCYLQGRLHRSPHMRGLLFAASIISYFLAMGSKENAAILPLAVILVEIVFFQRTDQSLPNRRMFWSAAGAGLFVFLTGTLFFLKGDFFSFVNGYSIRPFTLTERLLTEPRILFVYLWQVLLPLPGSFSIAHDVTISRSLFNPVTTLPAIMTIMLLAGFCIWQMKRRPILSFGVLFFLLNHIIESTVIPLELIFEHRNYLPTLFLFWPLAVGLNRLLGHVTQHRRLPMKIAVGALVILLIVGLGFGTYQRNKVWASPMTLWEDVLQKAPGIARPYLVLGGEYEKRGKSQTALRYYQKSLALPDQRPLQSRGTAYNNMGTIYFKNGDYETAISFYEQALELRPMHAKYLHNLVLALVRAREWGAALDRADLLVSAYGHNATYLNLNAYILLKQNKPETAISYLRRALTLAPNDSNIIINYGLALGLAGDANKADRVLNRAYRTDPANIAILMGLIENSLRAGDVSAVDRYADRLMATFSVGDIEKFLLDLKQAALDVPVNSKILAPALGRRLRQKFRPAG